MRTTTGGRGSRLGRLSAVAAAGATCALVGVPTAFADDVLNVDVANAFGELTFLYFISYFSCHI